VDPLRFCQSCGAKVVTPGPTCAGCNRPLVVPAVDNSAEHLKLLSFFHYGFAAFIALCGCFPMIHLFAGLVVIVAGKEIAASSSDGPPPAVVGWVFVIFASVMILGFWSLAALIFAGGRMLAKRRRYGLCIMVAVLCCLFMPFGTLLGVFTLVTLTKPHVKQMF